MTVDGSLLIALRIERSAAAVPKGWTLEPAFVLGMKKNLMDICRNCDERGSSALHGFVGRGSTKEEKKILQTGPSGVRSSIVGGADSSEFAWRSEFVQTLLV